MQINTNICALWTYGWARLQLEAARTQQRRRGQGPALLAHLRFTPVAGGCRMAELGRSTQALASIWAQADIRCGVPERRQRAGSRHLHLR
jgi:hypothetical protein